MSSLPYTATRIMFFTGKGGVGKTSLACATAATLADTGRPVLPVSTDPASNLDEVLGIELSTTPAEIPGIPRLFALNIDPDAAAKDAREDRYLTEVREQLAARLAWVPWYSNSPVGPDRLRELARGEEGVSLASPSRP